MVCFIGIERHELDQNEQRERKGDKGDVMWYLIGHGKDLTLVPSGIRSKQSLG